MFPNRLQWTRRSVLVHQNQFQVKARTGDQLQVDGLLLPVRYLRVGNYDEVAKVAPFLASNESSFITGNELYVDGGSAQI